MLISVFRNMTKGGSVPVKASGSMSTHSIVSFCSPMAKMRSTSLALYVWDLIWRIGWSKFSLNHTWFTTNLQSSFFTFNSEILLYNICAAPERQGAVLVIEWEICDFNGTSAAINSWG